MCSGEQSLHEIEKTTFTRNLQGCSFFQCVLLIYRPSWNLEQESLRKNSSILALPVGKKGKFKRQN